MNETVNKTMSKPQLPKTKGYPLLGVIPQVAYQFFDFVIEAREKYGDIYTLDLGITQMILLNHPDQARHVLVENVKDYGKGSGALIESVRDLLGNGLPMSEGALWARQRRMMQPYFHRQQLIALTERIQTVIESLIEQEWEVAAQTGEPFNVVAPFANITMKVIMKTMFGTEFSGADLQQMSEAMLIVLDSMFAGMITNSIPNWMPVPGRRRYQVALKTVNDMLYRVIEQRRQNPSDDLISMFVHAIDEETQEQMTPQQIRDEAATLFLGGYDTTATTLAWIFHFMTQQPEIGQRLQTEIDTVLDGRRPTYHDLANMPYSRMVFQETLRLFPPVYWLVREAGVDDDIDGYAIPKGTTVAVVTYALQRHPAFWQNPNTFSPERFLPERVAKQHKYAWIPFGAGHHYCIGREFAIMEAQFVLAHLLQRFHVRAVPGKVATPKVSTLMGIKDGVWVYLEKREG